MNQLPQATKDRIEKDAKLNGKGAWAKSIAIEAAAAEALRCQPLLEALNNLKKWYIELGKGNVTMNYDALQQAEEAIKNYNQ
jgi:hypothetical protein